MSHEEVQLFDKSMGLITLLHAHSVILRPNGKKLWIWLRSLFNRLGPSQPLRILNDGAYSIIVDHLSEA